MGTAISQSVSPINNTIIYPQIIFTDGYLNDPIQFKPDSRFEPKLLVTTLDVLPNQVNRDFSQFLTVDFNNPSPQYYSINTFSPLWNRTQYNIVITQERRAFTQLI